MTIMRCFLFVLLAGVLGGATSSGFAAPPSAEAAREVAPGVLQIGTIEDKRIRESSGMVASRTHPGVFWTHNDKGNKNRLFAISRAGRSIATVQVEGPPILDWEDIAIDDQERLYIADTGNNDGDRVQVAVHRIAEPDPQGPAKRVTIDFTWQLKYPNRPFDCESLFIWKDAGYLISKVTKDRTAELFRFPISNQTGPITLEPVGRLPITSPVTGADISARGDLLGVVCKSGAYAFRINGNVAEAARVEPWRTYFKGYQVEACCFLPEGLLATAESGEVFLFTDEAFRPPR